MHEHKLAAHYPLNLICECGIKFRYCSSFDDHYQSTHANIYQKIAFSKNPANRWLSKLYFIRSLSKCNFKIGITCCPLDRRLAVYRAEKYAHELIDCWQLPLYVNNHSCYTYQIENKIHLEIARRGFQNIGESPEFFNFLGSPDDETEVIRDVIIEFIKPYVFTEPLRLASKSSPNKLYLVHSESFRLGKIGYTTMPMKRRLGGINQETPGGNFVGVDVIYVDPNAIDHELKAWENDIIARIHERFGLVKDEYFNCSTSELDLAKQVFRQLHG